MLDTNSYMPIFAAFFALAAVVVVVALIIVRHSRHSTFLATMCSKLPSRKTTAEPPRGERVIDAFESKQDALGWTANEAVEGADASQNQSGVEFGAVLGREKTVLVADDDPVVLLALSRRLQRLGYQVMRSPDAAHALFGAVKVLPDLIILDISMPSGNGLAVCEMMACDQRCANIPVIVHSVLTDEAVKRRCQRLGAHYVEKSPRSWAEIRSLVESLLGETKDSVSEPVDAAPPAEKTPAPISHQAAPAEVPAQPAPPTGHRQILCLESPQGRLETVEHQLLAIGIDVSRTTDFEEGFWTCFTERPCAILTQIADDKQGLLGFLARLAQHPVTRAIPVLVINENDTLADDDLSSIGKVKILKYPVDWEDLLCELEGYLPALQQDELTSPASTARPSAAASQPHGQPSAAAAAQASLTFLCIDDDPVVARSIATRLQPYKIKLKSATDGTQGYLAAVTEKPDLILLDLKMPNGEGNYVLAKLKENSQTKSVPVIVLTVETNAGMRRQMFSMGADAYLNKPIQWPELFTEMGRCVRLPKQLLQDYKLQDQLTLAEL